MSTFFACVRPRLRVCRVSSLHRFISHFVRFQSRLSVHRRRNAGGGKLPHLGRQLGAILHVRRRRRGVRVDVGTNLAHDGVGQAGLELRVYPSPLPLLLGLVELSGPLLEFNQRAAIPVLELRVLGVVREAHGVRHARLGARPCIQSTPERSNHV